MSARVTFADKTTVWATGSGEIGPVLFRGNDDGATWTDMSSSLPRDLRFGYRITSLRFMNVREGYVVAHDLLGLALGRAPAPD